MKELSLNILDVAKNSVTAGATLIHIILTETDDQLEICIGDNGCGMKEETVQNAVNPFYTTRTTRSVGMGLSLLKMEAEMTGGSMTVESRHVSEYPENHGTEVVATFNKNHIDYIELGDIVSTITILISGSPEIDWVFRHTTPVGSVDLDTREIRQALGPDVPLDLPDVVTWMTGSLEEEYNALNYING